MHPAYSIIFFTVASGAGFGLIAVAAATYLVSDVTAVIGPTLAALVTGVTAAAGGLISSTYHLGRPERALRAFTQWRTSWLSREAIAAVAALAVTAVFFVCLLVSGLRGLVGLSAILSLGLAAITVFFTAMIYASLRPIAAWHLPHVPLIYLSLAAMTGALWFNVMVGLFGRIGPGLVAVAVTLTLGSWLLKRVYWRTIDGTDNVDGGLATGLSRIGPTQALDPPHTEVNYLQREMGFRVARTHAQKLRTTTEIIGFALPIVLTVFALALGGWAILFLILAASAATAGMLIERWLFFAEARHSVSAYYGAASE